ncbi:hypothetical protein NKG94_14755 [Micromonospora sp. M12]
MVLAAGGYGIFLKDARTGTVTVRPKGSATIDSFLFAEESTVAGHVTVGAGEVRLDRGTRCSATSAAPAPTTPTCTTRSSTARCRC